MAIPWGAPRQDAELYVRRRVYIDDGRARRAVQAGSRMRIGIIGANGMVGREVALFLALMGGEVVPICRSRLAGAFLERCGLTCRYGSVAFRDEAVTLLEDCDLVADFSLPRGSLHKCLTATRDL